MSLASVEASDIPLVVVALGGRRDNFELRPILSCRTPVDKLNKPLAWGAEDDTRRVFFNLNGVIWCLVDGTDIVLAGSLLAAMMVLDLLLCGLCGRRVVWWVAGRLV